MSGDSFKQNSILSGCIMRKFIILLLFAIASCNQTNVARVNVSSSLLVREMPNPESKVIDKLYNDYLVRVISDDSRMYTVKGVTGHYCYIKYDTVNSKASYGYVFSEYLERSSFDSGMSLILISLIILLFGFILLLLFNKKIRFKILKVKNKIVTRKPKKIKKLKNVKEIKNTVRYVPLKIFFAIGSFILISFVLMELVENYRLINSVEKYIMPPKPVVVSAEASDDSSTLFEYSGKIKVSVRNDGGDGYIVLEATVKQGKKSWTKSDSKYFNARETKDMVLVFDEIEFLSGSEQYTYRVSSYTK